MGIALNYDHAHFLCCSGRINASGDGVTLDTTPAWVPTVTFELETLTLDIYLRLKRIRRRECPCLCANHGYARTDLSR